MTPQAYIIPGIKSKGLSIELALQKVYGISEREFYQDTREMPIKEIRQICMWYKKSFTSETLNSIAKPFKRDHATVIHSTKTIDRLLTTDKDLKATINDVLSLTDKFH